MRGGPPVPTTTLASFCLWTALSDWQVIFNPLFAFAKDSSIEFTSFLKGLVAYLDLHVLYRTVLWNNFVSPYDH